MSELVTYLDSIDPYVSDGYWTAEEYDEAVHQYLHKQFGGLFEREVQLGQYSPGCVGEDHVMFLSHDHRARLESEMFEELCNQVRDGFMTDEEMEESYLEWLRTHRAVN